MRGQRNRRRKQEEEEEMEGGKGREGKRRRGRTDVFSDLGADPDPTELSSIIVSMDQG